MPEVGFVNSINLFSDCLSPSVQMRMSVLLAQESDDVTSTKMENMASTPVSSAKKKAGRKHSREKQQFGSKDSVKIVNEIGGQRNKEV